MRFAMTNRDRYQGIVEFGVHGWECGMIALEGSCIGIVD